MLIDLLLVPFSTTYREMRAAAVAAEEAGFNGLWTFDHLRDTSLVRPGPVPECWTVLSALAEATSRLQLGPLVLNIANRRPGLLANMAATLQDVSGGRLVLGLGAGSGAGTPYTPEQEMLGLQPAASRERAEQVAEVAQVLRLLWGADGGSFDGRHFQLRSAQGFLRPVPPPPIVIGGFGPRMATIAGRFGDGLNAPARLPGLENLVERARQAHVESGRDGAFEISLFSGFSQAWLDPAGRERAELDRLGAGRLILQVQPPYPLDEIRRAGVLLRQTT
jgi:alkanesulfonate monooxygenase SsuD/methylene tetrahydromethanopterin reductase-like flavin-dependent oxidoreductase (luciferase family)